MMHGTLNIKFCDIIARKINSLFLVSH